MVLALDLEIRSTWWDAEGQLPDQAVLDHPFHHGRRFGLDPWPARLLFVLLLLVVPGSQLLIYPVLWILMPRETTYTAPAATAAAPAG